MTDLVSSVLEEKNEILSLFHIFETRSLCTTLSGLKLIVYNKLISNSQISTFFCLSSTEIKDMCYHAQIFLNSYNNIKLESLFQ